MKAAVALAVVWAAGLLGCADSDSSRNPLQSGGAGDGATGPQVVFQDSVLGAAVREAAGESGAPLTAARVDSLSALTARGLGIADLSGIEQLHALRVLDLADNRIADIGPLAHLDSLVFLDLSGNSIREVSALAGLARLRVLALGSNQVADIAPLMGLGQLESVDLARNPLADEEDARNMAALAARGVQVTFKEQPQGPAPEPVVVPEFGDFLFAFQGRAPFGRRSIIWLETTRGGDVHPLVEESGDPHIEFQDWSPDGTQVLLRSTREDPLRQFVKTYVVNADGSGLHAVTGFYTNLYGFRWSPDGQRIAFVRGRGDTDEGDIQVMSADGSGARSVTEPEPAVDSAPTWSPDGRRLAFMRRSTTNNDPNGVYVADLETGAVRRIVDLSARNQQWLSWAPEGTAILSWSPDGASLLCSALVDPGPSMEVLVASAEGGGVRNLTTDPGDDWFPQWSPDGRRIAFTSTRTMATASWGWGDVFAMDADGSGLAQITHGDARYRAPSFTPDGGAIAYVSDRDLLLSIYLADLAAPQLDLNVTTDIVHLGDLGFDMHSGVHWQPR